MEKLIDFSFNPKSPTLLHLDLNSCFATIEQQANPRLRGKPIAVAAYDSPAGCIVAPSIEAKKYGVTVGMRVRDGKMLCPHLIVLTPDPAKYRNVHLQFRKLLENYTDKAIPRSIDEFVLDLEGYPAYRKGMINVAREIKEKIKREIGGWLTVSVGISTNRFLAKVGAGLNKPDGLDVIDKNNFRDIYSKLSLVDLCGIKTRNAIRLNNAGVYTVLDFYKASVQKLKAAFGSILAYYWYVRLHGWEIDNVTFGRRSYGNSFALPKPLLRVEELAPILQKLTEKTGMRMRKAGYVARGVHLAIAYRDNSFWHKGVSLPDYIFDSRDIYKVAFKLLNMSPYRSPDRNLAVSCFNLERVKNMQLSFLEDFDKKQKLVNAIDLINERWGNFVITPGGMLGTDNVVIDRIAFGGVKELEEIVI
ncbi:MAG: hypothetical protein ACD_24C00103G0003 [uncultured bacterium]|nr:MAG: hypothetical protein ACD_24C00103G0003 [uncultured bacterium]KKR58021.1 MAG: Nucleotidyltransferase/DNA polymerase involved in DNA repair [Candidatus Curtissbacteria bacterium GW2011_GWB1_40_28]KKR60957.1 MAG: Nucleotidyltransferase/DNA polymerase involved in DNA repair [Candidatus Curtissbacteria bacterium GW2011_GWA2_40_31]KKR61809.1 MAG: Nucleotidyltransferase/DNA polymerase involved in DNA repair [Microgenomates group bacterium GW2011_GWC1_40_35]KKR65873.1 MAG: Nucleotidyltransferas